MDRWFETQARRGGTVRLRQVMRGGRFISNCVCVCVCVCVWRHTMSYCVCVWVAVSETNHFSFTRAVYSRGGAEWRDATWRRRDVWKSVASLDYLHTDQTRLLTPNNWHIWQYRHTWHMTPVVLVASYRAVIFMAYITGFSTCRHFRCRVSREPNVTLCRVLLVSNVNCVRLSCVSKVLHLPSIMCVNSSLSRVKCHMYQVSCVSSGTWVKCHMYSIKYHVCQMSRLSIMSHVSYITCLVSFIRCEIEFAELNFTCQMLQVYGHVTEITGKV